MSVVSEITEMRKQGRLAQAYEVAVSGLSVKPDDPWLQMSLFWVLRDICLELMARGEREECGKHLEKMEELLPTMMDSKGIAKFSYDKLRQMFSPGADRINKAAQLSKTDPEKAVEAVSSFFDSPESLDRSQHEQFGWILYRYLKTVAARIGTERFTELMEFYLRLENPRPSILHSTMLKLVLAYMREHKDFQFSDFLVSWNVGMFQDEDYVTQLYNGKNIPSLVGRVCRQLASCPGTGFEILSGKTDESDDVILEYFREGVFWNLMNIHKECGKNALFDAFYDYAARYSCHGKSHWHSEILKLAVRYMDEQDSWRFLDFFRMWGYGNLSDADFNDISDENGNVAKSLAVKAAKKCFEICKGKRDNNPDVLDWLSDMFDYVIGKTQEDEWVLRQRAIIHSWRGEDDKARDVFKYLLLKMGDKYYIWSELADCVDEDDLKLALMSKALMIEKNEDYIGNIRLSMAEVLTRKGMFSVAATELDRYRKTREKLSNRYDSILAMIPSGTAPSGNNFTEVYRKFAPLAEEYVYSDLPEHILTLVDVWESDGRKFCMLTDGQDISIKAKAKRFKVLDKAKRGESFKVKCNSSGSPVRIVPDNAPLWHSLPLKYGYVEYLNEARKVLHIVTSDSNLVFCPLMAEWGTVKKGDFVSLRIYNSEGKSGKSLRCSDLTKVTEETASVLFPEAEVIVDNVNETKRLFHLTKIPRVLGGIVFFDDTQVRPLYGDRLVVRYYISKDKAGVRKMKIIKIVKN